MKIVALGVKYGFMRFLSEKMESRLASISGGI
jgi:hypothetical protein